MAKGAFAKENIKKKLAECFGDDYIGEVDKKIYIWQDDGNERVQIALALTCPKVQVDAPDGASYTDHSDWNFEDDAVIAAKAPVAIKAAEITEEEKARIADMMSRLGL